MHVPIFSAHAWFGRNSCFERSVNGAGTVPWNGCKTVTILGFCSVNAVLRSHTPYPKLILTNCGRASQRPYA